MSQRPLCFVLMPFGKKPTVAGATVDFDAVYHELIAPAVDAAGLQAIRADEEMTGGIIHKPMFERLILCEYAVADLTTANANVFYELGVRHAVRPWSTALLFAQASGQLPFDVAPLRAIPYSLDAEGKPADVGGAKATLTERLKDAQRAATDSPIFQLVENFPEVDHTKTDVFRDRVEYSARVKARLGNARAEGLAAVRAIEAELGDVAKEEAAVVIDLFLSYRAVKAWQDMIDLGSRMSPALVQTCMGGCVSSARHRRSALIGGAAVRPRLGRPCDDRRGARHRGALIIIAPRTCMRPARPGPNHDAAVRIGGEAPGRRSHSLRRPCGPRLLAGHVTSDRHRRPARLAAAGAETDRSTPPAGRRLTRPGGGRRPPASRRWSRAATRR